MLSRFFGISHYRSIPDFALYVSCRRTVAFSKWDHPYKLTAEQKKEKDENDASNKKPPALEGSNGPLMDDFFKQLVAGRKKWIVPEKMFCKLATLLLAIKLAAPLL